MGTTDEYRIIAAGAGWTDKRSRGRLRIDGGDAAAFLHALVSNDVRSLPPGGGAYTTLLTPQGRLIADLVAYRADDHWLIDTPPGLAGPLAARLDASIFTEDVRLADVSAALGQIAVVGPRAAGAAAAATGVSTAALEALAVRAHVVAGEARIARTDDTAFPSFDLFVPAAATGGVVAALTAWGAAPMSPALAEALRIDAGRPAFGIDMTDETIPLEAGLLDRAISLTKGCYVGQEVIVRILHRGGGRVAKRLVRLLLDSDAAAPPPAGAEIAGDRGERGHVTSAAVSPATGRVVALGYVNRDAAEVGRRVRVQGVGAEIVGLAG